MTQLSYTIGQQLDLSIYTMICFSKACYDQFVAKLCGMYGNKTWEIAPLLSWVTASLKAQ